MFRLPVKWILYRKKLGSRYMKKDKKTFVSLKKDTEFRKIYRAGSSAADRYLVIYKLKSISDEPRIGFSISKKLGKAVKRNRFKRKLREICRLNLEKFPKGHDYVIIVRIAAQNCNYGELEQSVFNVLRRLNKSGR